MKKLTANLIIALGAAAAFAGALTAPLLQDYLSVSFTLPAHGQAIQHYQAVLGEPRSESSLPYIAMLVGAVIIVIGVLFRRRFCGNAV